jgi:hypothetical protein
VAACHLAFSDSVLTDSDNWDLLNTYNSLIHVTIALSLSRYRPTYNISAWTGQRTHISKFFYCCERDYCAHYLITSVIPLFVSQSLHSMLAQLAHYVILPPWSSHRQNICNVIFSAGKTHLSV